LLTHVFGFHQVGSGYTVEGQKTGQEKHGGLQIEIIPSYRTGLNTWMSDAVPEYTVNDIYASVPPLDESRTPSELHLRAGDILRQYPPKAVKDVPLQVLDMGDGKESGEIQVEVSKPISECS
jgi:hypothetical protein